MHKRLMALHVFGQIPVPPCVAGRREKEARSWAPECCSWSLHHFGLGASTIGLGAVPLSHREQVKRGGKIQSSALSLGFAGNASKQRTGNLVMGRTFPR